MARRVVASRRVLVLALLVAAVSGARAISCWKSTMSPAIPGSVPKRRVLQSFLCTHDTACGTYYVQCNSSNAFWCSAQEVQEGRVVPVHGCFLSQERCLQSNALTPVACCNTNDCNSPTNDAGNGALPRIQSKSMLVLITLVGILLVLQLL